VSDVFSAAIVLAVLAPLVSVAAVGLLALLADDHPSERMASRLIGTGLMASVVASVVVLCG